jgi:hypothetical protein
MAFGDGRIGGQIVDILLTFGGAKMEASFFMGRSMRKVKLSEGGGFARDGRRTGVFGRWVIA